MKKKTIDQHSCWSGMPLHKKTVMGLMAAVLCIAGSAIAAPSEQWIKTFGNGGEKAYSVQKTMDGGYIFAGETASKDYVDAWLVKIDEKGNEQWSKTFGGTLQDYAYSVQQTKDGGYVIAGETISYGARNYNAWLIKTDAGGNELWNKTFGSDGLDAARIVQITKDGGYILAGYTSSYGAGSEDIWIIKTDGNGREEWNRTYGGIEPDEGYAVHQTSEGGYIVAGMTQSFGSGAYLLKIDASGREEWGRVLEGTDDGIAYAVQQTKEGGYIVAGEQGRFWADESDAWLIKTDVNGSRQWGKTFGGSRGDTFFSTQQTADDGFIVAGAAKSYGAGDSDIWIVKTDSEGNEEWNGTIGGKGADDARSVVQMENGYAIAGMYSNLANYDAMIARISGNLSAEALTISPDKEPASDKQVVMPGSIPGEAGAVPLEEWNRTFLQPGDDWIRSLGQTDDGGYILAGYTGDHEAGRQAWLIKADNAGNEQWKKTFRMSDYNIASSVQQTTDGGFVIAGYTGVNGSSYHAWLTRTDRDGNEQWNRTFGGESVFSLAHSVEQTSDGRYILAGDTHLIRSFWSEEDFDALLIKVDASGHEQWNRILGEHGRDSIAFVRQTGDGGYILAGMTTSHGERRSWGDALLIKTDPDGREEWNRTYYMADSFFQSISSVQQTRDGGYILAGGITFTDPVTYAGSYSWLIKTDPGGSEEWNRTFFGSADENRAVSAQEDLDGGYMLSGYRRTQNGTEDVWFMKTDAKGDEQWNLALEGRLPETRVLRTRDGDYILAERILNGDDIDIRLSKLSKGVGASQSEKKTPGFGMISAVPMLFVVYAFGRRRIK